MKILNNQILLNFEGSLMSSQEDSRVSHIQPLEKEGARLMTGTSGQKCLEHLRRSGLVSESVKMFAALLIGGGAWYSEKCNLIWKILGTESSLFYFQLAVSMPRIKETGSGLLPTPKAARGTYQRQPKSKKKVYTLMGLAGFGLLPTPTTREYKGGRKPETLAKAGRTASNSLGDTINSLTGKTSQLSTRFVAEMMGFPENWTELPFLNGEKKV